MTRTAGREFSHGSVQLPLTYLNALTSTLHFLSSWHQEGGAKPFRQRFGELKGRMRFVDHHLAHAVSAYAYSGFEDSAVVVMDGRGAWEATSIWRGSDGRLEHVLTIPFPDSVGLFYILCEIHSEAHRQGLLAELKHFGYVCEDSSSRQLLAL